MTIKANDSSSRIVVIEPNKANANYWKDVWHFRELLWFLAWRDILVRYKQTVIGLAWSLIRPFLTMVVFTVVFGKLAGLPSGGVPYPVLVMAGLLPWQFFANSLSESSDSLVSNANIISKVYFPRLIIPASSIVVSLVDFCITFGLMLAVMFWYGIYPDWRIIAIPGLLILTLAAALGAGLWFAALNTRFRDFRYIIPFAIQMGLYVSPVGFSSDVVMGDWRLIYSFNPMVAVIDGFRWALLGNSVEIYWPGFVISCILIVLLLYTGIRHFRGMEKTFADVI
jgi:lipopolysaccharide transport system permease protein